MTPISMMPPVDYCPSCEGRKDENKALDIGEARVRQAELQSEIDQTSAAAEGTQTSEIASPVAAGEGPATINTAVQPLLAPDLAVQATFARPFNEAGNSETEALRLRAAEAYRTP
ncbi:MAG: hypothetical protein AAGA21_04725 [Pseudomonadota bacterium]